MSTTSDNESFYSCEGNDSRSDSPAPLGSASASPRVRTLRSSSITRIASANAAKQAHPELHRSPGWDLSPLQRSASPERGPRTSATRPGPLAFEPPQDRAPGFTGSFQFTKTPSKVSEADLFRRRRGGSLVVQVDQEGQSGGPAHVRDEGPPLRLGPKSNGRRSHNGNGEGVEGESPSHSRSTTTASRSPSPKMGEKRGQSAGAGGRRSRRMDALWGLSSVGSRKSSLASLDYFSPANRRLLKHEGAEVESVTEAAQHLVSRGSDGVGPEREGHVGAVWVLKFSKDGKLLASGGHCGTVFLWRVQVQEEDVITPTGTQREMVMSVGQQPFKVLRGRRGQLEDAPAGGHSDSVIDLAWSWKNLLASASVDQSVRIWHPSETSELRILNYNEIVTSVVFHPIDQDLVLSGCLDGVVRMYDLRIPDREESCKPVSEEDTKGIVTALTVSDDGKTLAVGLFEGTCMFFDLDADARRILSGVAMKKVKSTRGKNAKGHKITGLEYRGLGKKRDFDAELLVSTADSRIRRYRVNNFELLCKYRGHANVGYTKKRAGVDRMPTQIRASMSEDLALIASGSEDGRLYIWTNSPPPPRFRWFSKRHVNAQPVIIPLSKREKWIGRTLATSTAFYPIRTAKLGVRDRNSLSPASPMHVPTHRYVVVGLSTGDIMILRAVVKEPAPATPSVS